jgi:hypothetical protein
MRTRLPLTVMALIALVLASCTAPPPAHLKAHSVAGLTDSQVAIVTEIDGAIVDSVDGRKLERKGERSGTVVEVLPGHHTLSVSYYASNGVERRQSTQDIVLTFDAEAGHYYLLAAVPLGSGWDAKITKIK